MFALIDGNSFYCSCERAFDPKLRNKPVVVLSNNDGCAIARTHEAKDLGVKMGEPYHLARGRPELKQVIWKSSNYALYGDMSRRMYEVLTELAPQVEPYSIDEMFLDFKGLDNTLTRAIDIRAAVLKSTKIPTCVGLGPTKTIAKLANAVAKKDRTGNGICDLNDPEQRTIAYRDLAVGSVWGLGPAAVQKLSTVGVTSIADYIAMPDDAARKLLSVVGLRTLWELRGISCLPLSLAPSPKKSLAVTRSFGTSIEAWPEMEQALSAYAARAAEKLRRHGLVAAAMQVFFQTNRFSKTDRQYVNQVSFEIEPTADSFALIASALRAARHLWRDGYRYAKAGIILLDLASSREQPDNFFPSRDPEKSAALMRAMDLVNQRFGRNTLRPAVVAERPRWGMRRANISPSYTTQPKEIMRVKA
jgi:DNA polymerase V